MTFVDPYLDPSLNILRNLVSATTQEKLDEIEREVSYANELKVEVVPHTCDSRELYSIHKALFGDIYDWAGTVRTVDIRKPNQEYFLIHSQIETAITYIFNELAKKNFLKNLPPSQFTKELAYFYEQLNFIHPFREGNGRTQRIFWSRIAKEAGYLINWNEVIGRELDLASIAGHEDQDLRPLEKMFTRIVKPIMKALLTSSGISNPAIEKELWHLLGGQRKGIKLLFIPTAYKMECPDNDDWLNEDIDFLRNLGFDLDIFDITGTTESQWLPKFKWAEAYYFEGGSTGWLRKQIHACGLEPKLPTLLKDRLWIGVSAGSVVLCPTICNSVQDLFDEDDFSIARTVTGLGLVDFDFIPHLNSPDFPKVKSSHIKIALKNLQHTNTKILYACDDNSAVSVDGPTVRLVGTGQTMTEHIHA